MKKYLSIMLLMIILCIPVQAYASPLAECYWQSNPGIGGTGYVEDYLDYMGYNGKIYSNTNAYYVRRTMDDDAVFYNDGHGGLGKMLCANSTYLTARISSPSYNYSLEAKFANTTDKLKRVRFAFYNGCHTAGMSFTLGNLASYTETLGVDCVLGFNFSVGIDESATYARYFFSRSNQGYSLASSDYYGRQMTYLLHGEYDGVQYRAFYGNSSIKLEPAAYGAY